MDINAAFPSKYLKSSEIPVGKQVTVTMSHVQVENVGFGDDPADEKPVVYFQGKSKGLVLNKTNSNAILAAFGAETEGWAGQKLTIYQDECDFAGRRVACLRVRVPPEEEATKAPAPPPEPQPHQAVAAEDIPF